MSRLSRSEPAGSSGITAILRRLARYLAFELAPGTDVHAALARLAEEADSAETVVGIGRSFDAFEAQMRRMAGLDDGITDALFRFTHPLTGAYFWCPPVAADGRLDLRALGL